MVLLTGIYAFSLQKIIPAAQGIYSQYTDYKYYKPTFEKIYSDLLLSKEKYDKGETDLSSIQRLSFKNKIELKDLSFRYPNSNKDIFNSENITISLGEFIGVAGKSGSGKTTLVDILIGLLKPTKGSLIVDGKKIDISNEKNWKRNIGYVSQSTFFADDTITNNIALGVDKEKIDFEKIKKVSKIAQISDFIEKQPKHYETIIGEDGNLLSQGQKQRINIARALYSDPKIIILDEATNSLDSETESQVLNSIFNNFKGKTIIMISHKLISLQNCDKIIYLEDHKIKHQGKFETVLYQSPQFKKMVEESLKYNKQQL